MAAAAAQVGRPTFFSMLIIILAHLPIFSLQRHEGRIFAPMAYTIVSALIGSLLFSLTLVPVLCVYLLENSAARKRTSLLEPSERLQTRAADCAHLAEGNSDGGDGGSCRKPDSSADARQRIPARVERGKHMGELHITSGHFAQRGQQDAASGARVLLKIPEVERVVSQAGRPDDGTDPKPINMVEMLVDLKEESQWRPHLTKEALIAMMEKDIDAMPGIKPAFSQPIRDNVLESISQIDGQIVIKLYGPDSAVLKTEIDKVLKIIEPIRGVGRAFVDRAGRIPQLQWTSTALALRDMG